MKFIGTTVAAIALTFSGFVFAESPAAGDVEKGKEIAAGICAGCHNADGNSAIPLYPILAGQYPGYIAKQLNDFKVVEGETVKRDNQIMAPMVATLSQDDIENLAAYYSQQNPNRAPPAMLLWLRQGRNCTKVEIWKIPFPHAPAAIPPMDKVFLRITRESMVSTLLILCLNYKHFGRERVRMIQITPCKQSFHA